MAGIYLHIPFCKQACHYCDFHFSTVQSGRPALLAAMSLELKKESGFIGTEQIETIYFGGGTPSLLSKDELSQLIDVIRSNYNVASDAEITLEANPDDLTTSALKTLYQSGINRLSIGVQSFQDDLLQKLNRAHTAEMARTCITKARDIGFENLTMDLMYGLPGLTDERWKEDLRYFLEMKIPHLSAYSLTIEPNTVFGKQAARQQLEVPDESLVVGQFQTLIECLTRAGFEQYEISNFSQPGFRSKHNTSYWLGKSYLGIGPSAHSYNGHLRRWNVAHNQRYISGVQAGLLVYEEELITPEMAFNEYLLTSLRTSWGVDLEHVRTKFGPGFFNHLENNLKSVNNELFRLENSQLILSEKGKLVADKITSDLFFA